MTGKDLRIIDSERIESKIYTIRGQRVMIDSDLAEMHGVETRRLNEQGKRKAERFPDSFMFQLTIAEEENLMSQFATSSLGRQVSKEKHGGRRKPVSAFSEHGILMLANVLRSNGQ